LLADNDWRIKTAVAIAMMQTTGKEMQAYPDKVPPNAMRLDGIVKDLGRDLVYIADEFTAGLDQGKPERINNVTRRMAGISAKTQAASAEINTITR
jgi:hypothetical protein